jgi:hypothetical protein
MSIRALGLPVVLLAAAPLSAAAQTIVGPVKAGACAIVVQVPAPVAPGTEVELRINKTTLKPRVAAEGKTEVRIVFTGPLEEGSELSVRQVLPNTTPDDRFVGATTVGKADGPPACAGPPPGAADDGREGFEASGYVGMAIDNFAPASVGGYDDSQVGGKQTRAVGGFDFEFRVAGSSTSKRQIWLFGETLHGVRHADINCAGDDKPAVCDKLTAANAGRQLQFVIDNASSLEAYVGGRFELATLQADGVPAKLYATVRTGVMMLNGEAKSDGQVFASHHAYRAHHVGGGLLMPDGRFQGSLLEVGFGRTDIFDNVRITNHWRRLKIDGSLQIKVKGAMYAFAQLYADFDPTGKAADSVQTFYGLSFSVQDLLGGFGIGGSLK